MLKQQLFRNISSQYWFLWLLRNYVFFLLLLQGKFQILSLSGSYLVAEDGGPSTRTGGISVSLSSRDGHVIGGGVAALIAGSPIQVYSCLP
jgi:argonaute-like protein implicated in RNA metabolism and viral defense